MMLVITLGLHAGCIGGIFITGIFGNFYTKRRGIFDFQNGNSRWPCLVGIWGSSGEGDERQRVQAYKFRAYRLYHNESNIFTHFATDCVSLPPEASRSAVLPLPRQVVCLSVRLSVTLRYRDHIGWNSACENNSTADQPNHFTLCRPQHGGSTPKGSTQLARHVLTTWGICGI